MTATAAPRTAALPLGHPVRSFVLALLLVGLALLALQWSGFIYPNIDSNACSSFELENGDQVQTVSIQNQSALPVEIVAMEWPSAPPGSVTGISPPPGSVTGISPDAYALPLLLEPFEPFTLDPGEMASLGVHLPSNCLSSIGLPTLKVRTASGLHRHVDLGSSDGQYENGCP